MTAASSSDNLSVSVKQEADFPYAFIRIVARGEVENATVTVSFKEAPETTRVIRVTVSPDAKAVFPGMADTPDLGALYGVAPSSFGEDTTYAIYPDLVYDASALAAKAGSTDKAREGYAAALEKEGFVLADTSSYLLGTYTVYTYTNGARGINVSYTEYKRLGRVVDVTVALL